MTEELQPSKISRNIYKAVLYLICGIVVLSTLECINLLKSPQYFIEEGKNNGLDVWFLVKPCVQTDTKEGQNYERI